MYYTCIYIHNLHFYLLYGSLALLRPYVCTLLGVLRNSVTGLCLCEEGILKIYGVVLLYHNELKLKLTVP